MKNENSEVKFEVLTEDEIVEVTGGEKNSIQNFFGEAIELVRNIFD